MKIYIAASAAPGQSARVAHVIAVLKAAGHTITCTWPEVVAATPGGSNPRDASDSARRGWSTQDLAEIDAADALLFLVPPPPQTTRGAWYESGYADKGGKRVVFAGDTKQSVFCARGEEYADDVDAIASLTASRSHPQANAAEARPAGGETGPRIACDHTDSIGQLWFHDRCMACGAERYASPAITRTPAVELGEEES